MSIKIDTKEKFTVITPEEADFSAILSEQLVSVIHTCKQCHPPHVILNLSQLKTADSSAIQRIIQLQHEFYNDNLSFVICGVDKSLLHLLEESTNITPTESEAWDIVQMEEIEREILGDDSF